MPRPLSIVLLGGLVAALLTPVPSYAEPSNAVPPVADRAATRHVVGHGTPASCTAVAFRKAVAKGGTITFDCGPNPVTIVMDKQAEVHNDASRKVVIDGGGPGHPRRRRQAPDPLPEHLRQATRVDHVALQ